MRSLCCTLWAACVFATIAQAETIPLHASLPPLVAQDSPPGGSHPIGGPAAHFVDLANQALASLEIQLELFVTADLPPSDRNKAKPSPVTIGTDFADLHRAVAAGSAGGGFDLAISLPNQTDNAVGELLVAGLPFGLGPEDFAAWLFAGGGLALHREIYDRIYDDHVQVWPVGITGVQGGGWFPEALPNDPDPDTAMTALCQKPWIVRWPEPGAGIWRDACAAVGIEAADIGPLTRCENPAGPCPAAGNPAREIAQLTFGGFVPGAPPMRSAIDNQIDAYELNLPLADALLGRRALRLDDIPLAAADLSPLIQAAPYHYGATWHQRVSYVELLANKAWLDGLAPALQALLPVIAKAAVMDSLAHSQAGQGRAVQILERNGAIVEPWPDSLLVSLEAATDRYLDKRAAGLIAMGDNDYARLLDHMRAYQETHEAFVPFTQTTP
ncbi:MAG: hypothetical protein AAFY56_14895 [Pseudomonadota bacterium]